jgi:hypothetical protein
MKKLLSLSFTILAGIGLAFSQAPNRLSYQAVVRNSSGVIVPNGSNVAFRFSIRDGGAGGTILYQETMSQSVNNNFGQVAVSIGSGTVQQGSFPSAAQWGSGTKFLQIEVDPAGGSSYTDLGAVQLMSVPYAQYANSAGSAVNVSGSIAPSQISSGGASNGQVMQWNGSSWVPATVSGGGGGDITDVTAGTGLTGGGTSGSVTLNANNTAAMWNANQLQGVNVSSASVSNGDVLKFNGTAWAPGADNNTITTAGTGLSISGNTMNSVWTASGNNIYHNNSGNVGIGTNSPLDKFHLKGSSNQLGRLEFMNNGWLAFYKGTRYLGYMGNYTDTNGLEFGTNNAGPDASVHLVTNASPKLTVVSSGAVGIGTRNPTNGILHLHGASVYNGLHFTHNTSGSNSSDGFLIGPYTTNSNDLVVWNFEAGSSIFGTSGTEKARIDADGNVGVNTTTPTAKLHVNGATATSITGINSSYAYRASILGIPDTSLSNYAAGVVGYGKGGSFYNTGIAGSAGNSGNFNIGGTFESKAAAITGKRNYGTYTDVAGGYVFTIGSYLGVTASTNSASGVYGYYSSVGGSSSVGTYGGFFSTSSSNTSTNYGIYATASTGATNYAGYFAGNVTVTGTLSKGGGTFQIDHPLDPENKYLYHSFVESPDMLNIYNGNIVTNADGEAVVELPSYFSVENIDYKYQLTVIGQFAQAIVMEEISDNKFSIKTDKPNVKVSWQVTGVRNDRWANANRVVPEKEKEASARGKYIHPELYGQPAEKGIHFPNTKGVSISEASNQK